MQMLSMLLCIRLTDVSAFGWVQVQWLICMLHLLHQQHWKLWRVQMYMTFKFMVLSLQLCSAWLCLEEWKLSTRSARHFWSLCWYLSSAFSSVSLQRGETIIYVRLPTFTLNYLILLCFVGVQVLIWMLVFAIVTMTIKWAQKDCRVI